MIDLWTGRNSCQGAKKIRKPKIKYRRNVRLVKGPACLKSAGVVWSGDCKQSKLGFYVLPFQSKTVSALRFLVLHIIVYYQIAEKKKLSKLFCFKEVAISESHVLPDMSIYGMEGVG